MTWTGFCICRKSNEFNGYGPNKQESTEEFNCLNAAKLYRLEGEIDLWAGITD